MYKVLALVLAIVQLICISFIAGGPKMFIDFWCFALTLGFTLTAVIGRHGFKGFGHILRPNRRNPVLKTILGASIFSGFIGVLIGVITILSNMENISMIGPAAAISLVSLLYGVFQGYLAYILIDEY